MNKASKAAIETNKRIKADGIELAELVERARELIVTGAKPAYVDPFLLAIRLAKYLTKCKSDDEPITKTGLRIAANLNHDTYWRYESGEMDDISILCIEPNTSPYRSREGDTTDLFNSIKTGLSDMELETYNFLTNAETPIRFSEVLEKAAEMFREYVEVKTFKRGSIADIFHEKIHCPGHRDDSQPVHQHLTLNVGNANEALKLLGSDE